MELKARSKNLPQAQETLSMSLAPIFFSFPWFLVCWRVPIIDYLWLVSLCFVIGGWRSEGLCLCGAHCDVSRSLLMVAVCIPNLSKWLSVDKIRKEKEKKKHTCVLKVETSCHCRLCGLILNCRWCWCMWLRSTRDMANT